MNKVDKADKMDKVDKDSVNKVDKMDKVDKADKVDKLDKVRYPPSQISFSINCLKKLELAFGTQKINFFGRISYCLN